MMCCSFNGVWHGLGSGLGDCFLFELMWGIDLGAWSWAFGLLGVHLRLGLGQGQGLEHGLAGVGLCL